MTIACAPRAVEADTISLAFYSWDVTLAGVVGQFDIANQTGPNSSGDSLFPVTSAVTLIDLMLEVDLSDGSTLHVGAADFVQNPFDGLSWESPQMPIGGANPQPVRATLSGSFGDLALTLFDGTQVTILPGFSVVIDGAGQALSDGALAVIRATIDDSTEPPPVPEPSSLLLVGLGISSLGWRFRARRQPPRNITRVIRVFVAAATGGILCATPASAQIRMNVSTQPSAGIAGTSVANAIGSGFPSGHGAIVPSAATIFFSTTCEGEPVAQTDGSTSTLVLGSQYRIGFTVPPLLVAGNYYVSLTGTTSDGTRYASVAGSCSQLRVTGSDPRLAACTQSSALAIHAPPSGGAVTAYASNGCANCATKGVQAVTIEEQAAPRLIATPDVVNSCASNPVTGKTVCVANNTNDVYVIEGTTIAQTLHSAAAGTASQSGGSCKNCGVAINAVTNEAVIAIALPFTADVPYHSGFQVLDLDTNTFSAPVPSVHATSEHFLVDPFRRYVLSPNEAGNYALHTIDSGGAFTEFGHQLSPPEELDSAAMDCSTGIALAPSEGSAAAVYMADLTRIAFTAGSPGSWKAPDQIFRLSDFPFQVTGISVAQGTHVGIMTPEFVNGGRFVAFRLPDRGGTGVPSIVDYAWSEIPGFRGTADPHPVAAYTSPNDGRAYGVFASGFPATALARVDLECVLALPRVPGGHGVSGSGANCFKVIDTGNAAAAPPTIISSPLRNATAGVLYSYKLSGSDANSFALTYSLTQAPAGMVINGNTGQIQWIPETSQAGVQNVTAVVRNVIGLTGTQSFQITVNVVVNRPPSITSSPVTSGAVGALYSYQLTAVDPDNRPLTYSLLLAPEGMTIDPVKGLIRWVPAANAVGSISTTVAVRNAVGLSDSQSFQIRIPVPQNLPPVITSVPVISATVGQVYTYQVRASDPNGDPLAFSFVRAPVGMTIDASSGLIRWTPASEDVGRVQLTVRAQDPGRLTGTQSLTLTIGRAYPVPVITVLSPLPGSVVNAPVDVIADITDPSPGDPPIGWTVELVRADGFSRRVAAGDGAVSGGAIAHIDPTLLRDDGYALVITVSRQGQVDRKTFDYDVHSGSLKLGNYTTSYTDISIPVAGIPMVITRTHDTLDTSPADFGNWRLALPGQVADSARENPLEPFTQRTRIYVTRPDGRRVGFTFAPTQPTIFPIFVPGFRPDPGVTDTLSVDPANLSNTPGGFVELLGGPYNPRLYTLTTKEGVRYLIDEVAGLLEVVDRNGNSLQLTSAGMKSSRGVALAIERDGSGRITRIGESEAQSVRYVYDAKGNLTSSVDQRGNETKYFYENDTFPHDLTRIEDPLGRPVTRNFFGDDGRLTAVCGPSGNPQTLDGCQRFEYDSTVLTQVIVNARGFRTDLQLDDRGNVLSEVHHLRDGRALETRRTYDPAGRLVSTTSPSGATSSASYDARGNVIVTTDTGGKQHVKAYGVCDAMVSDTDPLGNKTTYEYDERCNLRFVRDPAGNLTEYRYTADGLRTHLIDAAGNTWTWTYGPDGYPASRIDPFGRTTQYSFNSTGDLIALVDRMGRRLDFTYDASHNLVTERWANGYVKTLEYNHAGQLLRATAPAGTTSIQYTEAGYIGNVEQRSGSHVASVAYGHDLNGHTTTVEDSFGGIAQYEYDEIDRLVRIRQRGIGVQSKRVDVEYDDDDTPTAVRRYADLDGALSVANTRYSYDCGGCSDLIAGIRHHRAGDDSALHDLSFLRDAAGNIVSMSDADGLHTYTYDAASRLLSGTHHGSSSQPPERYAFDRAGNIVSSTQHGTAQIGSGAPGSGNRLTNDAAADFEYDFEGNLVRQIDRSHGTVTQFGYDFQNRLIEISRSGNQPLAIRYQYDALGRRLSETRDGAVARFVYDEDNPIVTLRGDDRVISRRLYGDAVDSLFADEVEGSTEWLLGDHLRTTRDVVSNAGDIIAHYSYDSFGAVRAHPGNDRRFLFVGREVEPATGLLYLRNRTYDPGRGRFLQEDPREPMGYEYASDNPLRFIDLFGETATEYQITGRRGEMCAGVKGAKTSFMNGKRIPDIFVDGKLIGEVKNVRRLYLTRQLKDYMALATSRGIEFHLHIAADTVLSGPLRTALANNSVALWILPDPC